MTESNPPAKFVWKKQLANETLQSIAKNHTLSIPNVQFEDSGIYICEVTNEVTNQMENRTVMVSVQGITLKMPCKVALNVLVSRVDV